MPENIEETEEVDEGVDDFEEGDYGFIIGPDGELKSIMLPEDLFEDPPDEIKKILKIFGIFDVYAMSNMTLH
jgi:hypothetical protein